MASKSGNPIPQFKRSMGEEAGDDLGALTDKIRELEKQIQADRVASVKEKLETNEKKLEGHVSQLMSVSLRHNLSLADQNGIKMLLSRIENPLCKFSGFSQGSEDKDYVYGQEVVLPTSSRLPHVQKIPPYTTWIFLHRNQRMADDQSVVGRRRIYYDQHGSEALICSDSEEEFVEPEEEKHEFSEGEDRILWMVSQEHGLSEEVMNIATQFVGGTTAEIEERCKILMQKFEKKNNRNLQGPGETGSERSILLDKSLTAALDSFDNIFCRRCLVFDCRLHGCSQTLTTPCEKQLHYPETEGNGKPCSDQCYLRLKESVKHFQDGLEPRKRRMENVGKKESARVLFTAERPKGGDITEIILDERFTAEKGILTTSEAVCCTEGTVTALTSDISVTEEPRHESMKRKVPKNKNIMLDDTTVVSDDFQGSFSKKQKKLSASDVIVVTTEAKHRHPDSDNEVLIVDGCSMDEPTELTPTNHDDHIRDEAKDVKNVPKKMRSNSSTQGKIEGASSGCDWKPIEKELCLKGIEIFGRNSCLIARNLLSGFKNCMEVSRYMRAGEAAVPNRSVIASSNSEDNGKEDTDYMEQEMPTRSRMLRRRGRTRKLKYSWKSAGHPSVWKRIVDGKNQSCKQYTPCGCESMCSKQCPCLLNGTCCEKYCGCSKSCKNRFRGCHCAKSQCRSRQCPCFAAGRECDPDVCRNCWISCGRDEALGEPPKRGDGQCGNMKLLLRQQQKILLAKSDVAGWGAFIKNSVNKNDYLGEYTGELISHREADKRGKIYDRANSSFLFDLNDQYVLDAYRKGDKLKFANHSSNPNCYAKVMLVAGDNRVGIFAKERIEASEELFYDYRYGPDQAPIWARKSEGSKKDDFTVSQGRAKKHQ